MFYLRRIKQTPARRPLEVQPTTHMLPAPRRRKAPVPNPSLPAICNTNANRHAASISTPR
ncbi:hypothetical protein BDW22DRAFT_1355598 [Trametopsis cervina]|nr:hypothetical protein BDW22DRAFT_1355598 [Trametopsis cervina]